MRLAASRRRQIDGNQSYVTHSASSSEATRSQLVVIRLPDRPHTSINSKDQSDERQLRHRNELVPLFPGAIHFVVYP